MSVEVSGGIRVEMTRPCAVRSGTALRGDHTVHVIDRLPITLEPAATALMTWTTAEGRGSSLWFLIWATDPKAATEACGRHRL